MELADTERFFPEGDVVVGEFGFFVVARAVIGDEKQEGTGIVGVFFGESGEMRLK